MDQVDCSFAWASCFRRRRWPPRRPTGASAASADKPDARFAACGRIIDDASESVAERVRAFKNRGRGAFNSKDYDRAIADYSEAIKLSAKDLDLCAPV